MPSAYFFVPGAPAPGGSKNARIIKISKSNRMDPAYLARYPRLCQACGSTDRTAVSDAGGKANETWKKTVKATVRSLAVSQYPGVFPLAQACSVDVLLVIARPKSHRTSKGELTKRQRESSGLHEQKPDGTKLWRSTEDALSEVLWKDDVSVVEQRVAKAWNDDCPAGLYLRVTWGNAEVWPRLLVTAAMAGQEIKRLN